MAEVARRMALRVARNDAASFMAAVGPWCERIAVVGSVRRGRAEVADVEYVVIPKVEEVPGPGLFGETVTRNLLWAGLDRLVETGAPLLTPGEWEEAEQNGVDREGELPGELTDDLWTVAKALRGDPLRACWGERQRAVQFRGATHELFLADADNWGSMMVIRTGPAAFSRFVVTELRRCGFKHEGGRVIDCSKAIDPVVPTPDERSVFDLIGIAYREPKDRVGLD